MVPISPPGVRQSVLTEFMRIYNNVDEQIAQVNASDF